MNSTRNKIFFRVNNTDYNISGGFQLEDLLNEDLDSAKVALSHIPRLELNSMDKVTIYETDYLELSIIWKKNYLLASFTEEQVTFGEEILYNYVISLSSPTLILENHIRPNMTITRKNKTGYNWIPRTIRKILNADKSYQQELKEELGGEPELDMSDDFTLKVSNYEVLETQLPNMNLREIINELLEPCGFVVKMNDYRTIDYLDLNAKGNPIDITKLVSDTLKQDVSTYASHFKLQAENCLGNVSNITEKYVGVRSDDYVITTDNTMIPTKNAIYDLEKVLLYFNGTVQVSLLCWYGVDTSEKADLSTNFAAEVNETFDITDYICTKEIFDTLKIGDTISYSDVVYSYTDKEGNYLGYFDYSIPSEYKVNHLYFNQNQKNIKGLTFYDTNILGTKFYSYSHIIELALTKAYFDGIIAIPESVLKDLTEYQTIELGSIKVKEDIDPRDLIFDVQYKASENLNLEFEKTNEYKNKRVLVDSQQASYLDNVRLGKSMQEKINRTGNKTRIINARYSKYTEVPSLGDYIDDYILTKRNIVFYPNEVLFQGVLDKDFSMKNLVSSLKQQKRYTSIDISNNVLIRNENYRIVCDVSTSVSDFASRPWNTFINYLLNNYGKNGDDLLWVMKTIDSEGLEYGLFKINPTIQRIGNFIAISYKCDDNYSVGLQVDSKEATGGYSQSKTRYVDDLGEFTELKLTLYKGHTYDITNSSDLEKMKLEAQISPIIDSSLISGLEEVWSFKKQYNKDNREILGFTMQLEFRGGENVIVKELFLDYLSLILKENAEDILPLQLYVNEDDLFTKEDTIARGQNLANVPGNAVFISNNRIEVNSDLLGLAKSWCIATKYDKKILIAVNSSTNVINFNFDLNI